MESDVVVLKLKVTKPLRELTYSTLVVWFFARIACALAIGILSINYP